MDAKQIQAVQLLPAVISEVDRAAMDAATLRDAANIALSTMTNAQKNRVINCANGGKITVGEFMHAALENSNYTNGV